MADEASAGETAKTGLSARLADTARWPRRWWWPDASVTENEKDVDIVRRHDEASKTIRRVMMILIAYGFFCLLTLAQPDTYYLEALGTEQKKLKVPFANIDIAFTDFLIVGPLVLIGLALYLHIFIGYWHRIPLAGDGKALPFIFNMNGAVPRWLTGFLFYWLVPVVLWIFTYKTGPFGLLAPLLLLLTVATASVLLFLQIRRTFPERRRTWGYRCVWAVFAPAAAFSLYLGGQQAADLTVATYRSAMGLVQPVLVAGLPAPPRLQQSIQLRIPEGVITTPRSSDVAQTALGLTPGLNLAGADLRKLDLGKRDLRGGNLRGANLSGVDLTYHDLRGADLTDADLSLANLTEADLQRANLGGAKLLFAHLERANLNGANLDGADIRLAIGLNCSLLRRARNWQRAFRDKKLACGKPIPKPPAKAR